jgi:hypothetical protein
VLGADPLKDIRAVRNVERVLTSGAWIDVARYRAY